MPDSVNLGSVYATAELRLDKLEAGMRQMTSRLTSAETQLKQSGERMKQTANLTGIAIGAGLGFGLLALGKQILDATVKFDSLKRGLTSITHSSAETERQLVRLREVAKLPGLGFEEAIEGSIRLQSAGMKALEAEKALKAFGNAIAVVGGGKAQLAEVTLALQQLSNRTSGFGQEIRQLQNVLPDISQKMKAAFGTAVAEDVSRSGITGAEFIRRLTAEYAKVPPLTSGIKNALENLKDAAGDAFRAIGTTGLPMVERAADKATEALKRFTTGWKDLPKPVQDALLGGTGVVASLSLAGIAVNKTKDLFTGMSLAAVGRLGLIGAAAASVVYAIDRIGGALERQEQINKDRANTARQLSIQPDLKNYLRQIDEIKNSVQYSPFMTPEGRKIAEDTIKRIQADANRLVAPFRARVPAATSGGRNAPAAVDVPITSQGRYVQVQQQMIAVEAQIKALEDRAEKATTNAQRNILGVQILNLKARESRLQDILDQFDPAKRQKAIEEAKKEAEDKKRINEGLTQDLERETLSRYEAERRAVRRAFQDTIRDHGDRIDAQKLLDEQLKRINAEEFQARTGGGFFQLLPSVEEVGVTATGFMALTKILTSATEAAGGLGQAFADSMKTAEYFFNLATHNVEKLVSAAKDALDGLGAAFGNVIRDAQYLDAQMKKQGEADWSKAMEDYLMNGRVRAGEQRQQQFQQGFKRQFDFMKDLAHNVADEFYDGFANGLEKIFGKNPLGRAFARTLDHWLSSAIDSAIEGLFKKKESKVVAGGGAAAANGIMPGDMPNVGGFGIPGVGKDTMMALMGVTALIGALGNKKPKLSDFLAPLGMALGFGFGGIGGGMLGGAVGGIVGGIGKIFGFAEGGIMPAGRLALVGERGPELVMPTASMRVIPNGAGMTTINAPITVHAAAGMDVRQLAQAVGYEVYKLQRVRQGSG